MTDHKDKPEATIATEKDHDHKEEDESSSDEEGHDHHDHDGHDHAGHDHAGKPGDKKANKGEKKLKKAMGKLGMKPVTGINRVSIKKAKVLLYIEDPEILKSPGADNTYVVFGEVKLQDFPGAGLG